VAAITWVDDRGRDASYLAPHLPAHSALPPKTAITFGEHAFNREYLGVPERSRHGFTCNNFGTQVRSWDYLGRSRNNTEKTMHWQIEPFILPLMVATLLLIAALQAGHG
jgi:hypothetical protein